MVNGWHRAVIHQESSITFSIRSILFKEIPQWICSRGITSNRWPHIERIPKTMTKYGGSYETSSHKDIYRESLGNICYTEMFNIYHTILSSLLARSHLKISLPSQIPILLCKPLIPSNKPKLPLPLPPMPHTPLYTPLTRTLLFLASPVNIATFIRPYNPLRSSEHVVPELVRSVDGTSLQIGIFTT